MRERRHLCIQNDHTSACQALVGYIQCDATLKISHAGEQQELADTRAVIEAAIQQPDKALVFLRPGRLVRIREGAVDWGWGIVCSVSRRPGNGAADAMAAPASHYMLDTLLATAAGSMKGASRSTHTAARLRTPALCASCHCGYAHHMSA